MVAIEARIPTSTAEQTIAWFYSGRKQKEEESVLRIDTPCNGIENDAGNLQKAIDFAVVNGGAVYLPPATLTIRGSLDGKYVPCMRHHDNDGHSFMLET